MLSKLVIMQFKLLAQSPLLLLSSLVAPFGMYALVPGFNSSAFPGFLIVYIVFSPQSGGDGLYKLEITRCHFPVTRRELIQGLFLFQAAMVLVAGLIAAGFVAMMELVSSQVFMRQIISKAMALSLVVAGISPCLALNAPQNIARAISALINMAITLLLVLTKTGEEVFLSWLSLPACLAIGMTSFIACYLIALKQPEATQRRPA
ncbi:MAG: ABC-2 transporter permease [Christensenellales bacterium]|jgi:hypothetical protein